jgi:diguanylate cyclase (GGDEF)-like protein
MQIIKQKDVDLAALKKMQTHYLDTMGVDFSRPEYFEARLKIGWTHARMGVPLSLYQSACLMLQEIFIRHISAVTDNDAERQSLITAVLRLSNLDMSLAISAYHHTQVHKLEDSLKSIKYERVQLMRKASTDELTHLPNRAVIKDQLCKELEDLQTHQGSIHLIMADLDYFKQVNDRYGHLVGDIVLAGAANRIRQSLRGTDVVGRFGGEEFIILLRNKSLQQAEQIAERIRDHVASTPINANGQHVRITLSQGLASAAANDSADSLIEIADKALYEAKRTGRNCVVTARR